MEKNNNKELIKEIFKELDEVYEAGLVHPIDGRKLFLRNVKQYQVIKKRWLNK